MGVLWVLSTAIAAVLVLYVQCDHSPEIEYGRPEDIDAGSVFGFRPCLDESCENYDPAVPDVAIPSDHEPNYPEKDPEYTDENPRVHCIMLRPSAVSTFGEIESMHPGVSDIKYRILEELIEHMYSFAELKLDNCQPTMKLIDLVILAANSLRTQYILKGEENCTYEEHHEIHDHGEHVPGYDVTEMPEVVHPADEPCKPGSMEYPCAHSIEDKPIHEPCPHGSTEYPCHGTIGVTEDYSEEIEIVAEDETHFPIVGSLRGQPGVDYPNYSDIPLTSFTCADKKYIPGFYADLETRCQVFHVCYEHRRESFLCPVGTVFNQPILACDYWYNSNCSITSQYYDVNEKTGLKEESIDGEVEEILTSIAEDEKSEALDTQTSVESDLEEITPFFPVKAVVTDLKPEIPVKHKIEADKVASIIVDNIVADTTKIVSSVRDVVKAIPVPHKQVLKVDSYPFVKKPMKMHELLAQSAIPFTAAKLAAIPVSKASLKTVPVVKAKVAVPVAAAKMKFATKVAAIPSIKLATSPFLAKTKMAAASVPAAKIAVAKAVPAAKVAVTKAAVVAAPVVAKAAIVPAAKIAVAKAVPAAKIAVTKSAVVAAPVVAKAAIVPAAKIAVVKAAVAAPTVAKVAAVPAIKIAAAVPIVASVPKLAVKSSIPALKTKMIASAVPIAKTKVLPVMKAKVLKSAGAPFLKAKMLALPLAKSKFAAPVPLAKVKLAKAAAISPLTKKALALGYMKLLKAKKVALMG